MAGFNFDMTTLLMVWMGAAVLMVPLLALALRLAVVPLLEAVARLRQGERNGRLDAALAERLAGMEAEIRELSRTVRRMDAEKPIHFEP